MSKEKIKFQFTTEWQWDLLRFIAQDRNGYKALKKVKDDYFTLIEHQVLAHGFINHYSKHYKIPGETILREEIVNLLNSKHFVNLVTKSEQDNILKQISPLYQGPVRDSEDIYEMCKKFSSYIRFKEFLEEVDPRNWEEYQQYGYKLHNIIEDEDEQDERVGSFLFGNVSERQMKRREIKPIIPTPFRQINQLTNAGGYERGSIIVLLDKEKKGKTAALVNIARGYIKQGKSVLYLDFENGKESILTRLEQSFNNLSKLNILEGEHDEKVKRKFRKYKRTVKADVVVERLPAGSNAGHVQALITKYYREHGIQFNIIIGDYFAKMGSLSHKKDDTERISDVYMDMSNLALKNDIDHMWTANHVTRDGADNRMKTRYKSTDIAKCIDIVRHVHAIFGLNRSPDEEEAGFLRFEVVEQRDGVKGRAVFMMDFETQKMAELTKAERQIYDDDFAPSLYDENPKERKAKREGSSDDFKAKP